MNMSKMMKDCGKPHMLSHSVSGAGVAFLVLHFVPSLGSNLLVIGLVLLVAGVVWDVMSK